jgi:outer membrane protein with beta-barrel domain
MKRLVCCSVVALLAFAPASARAQRTYLVGVGTTLTTGDYADVDSVKSGTSIMAGVERPMFSSSTSLRIDGMLSKQRRLTAWHETQYLAGVNANVVLWVPMSMASLRPYLLGGLGYLYNKYNPGQKIAHPTSKSEIVFGGGAGAEVSVGPFTTFVEGRYTTGSDVKSIIPLFVGLRMKASQ